MTCGVKAPKMRLRVARAAASRAAAVTNLRLDRIYMWMHAPRLRSAVGRPSKEVRSGAHGCAAGRAALGGAPFAVGDRRHDCPRGRHRVPAALVVLASTAIVLAGCGGGSGLTVVSITGSSRPSSHRLASRPSGPAARFVGFAPSPAQRAKSEVAGLLFSRCMRAHGVPGFPDPPAPSGAAIGFSFGSSGIDPGAPLFRAAQRVCISVLTRQRGGFG